MADSDLKARLNEELAPDLEIIRLLGRGSVAEVFLAREPALGRLVAVKVLSGEPAGDEQTRLRFEREARAAASLSHANVVPVHHFGTLSDDVPYLVMQYVKGRTLADRLEAEGPLPLKEARRILGEVASALAAAHRQGFVHRDVRPGNVLFEEETGRTLLADFGIAAVLATGGERAPRITREGELLGRPDFTSPEQLSGEDVTELADVYSFGVLGYHLLGGRGPYDARSDRELLAAHLREEPAELREIRTEVDPKLSGLLKRCLAKAPRHRPSASEVVRALEARETGGAAGSAGAVRQAGRASLLDTLLRRRMPQFVAAAAAGGWLLLQLVDQLVDRAVIPRVWYLLTLNLVVFGLGAVGVSAWFHGARGQQRFTRLERSLLGILAVLWLLVSGFILAR